MSEPGGVVTVEDFEKLDIRVGRVVEAQPFPEGRHSTHVLLIDFGPILGTKKSLAKLAPNYEGDEVVGRPVLAVVNFPPRQIGSHQSEVLTLGEPAAEGNVGVVRPDAEETSSNRTDRREFSLPLDLVEEGDDISLTPCVSEARGRRKQIVELLHQCSCLF